MGKAWPGNKKYSIQKGEALTLSPFFIRINLAKINYWRLLKWDLA
jgi:hypothetical protein